MSSSRLHYVFAAAVVTVIAGMFVALQQIGPGFLDPDSFYHAKIAQVIITQGLPDSFPWLQFTTMRDVFVDQHVLYHYALIPFVWFGGMFVGTRIATVIFAVIMAAALWWLLIRRQLAVGPWAAAVLAVIPWLTEPFVFRMGLAKAGPLALLWLLLGWIAVEKKRPWWLAGIAAVYVLTHGGWLMLWVVTGTVLIVHVTAQWWHTSARSLGQWVQHWWQTDVRQLWLALIGGTAVGLVAHPHFPANLKFYWQQLVQIGMVNYGEVVRVGGEWRAYSLVEIITLTPIISALLILAVAVWGIYGWRSRTTWASAILTAFFFIITLKSRRYVEYYVPTAVTFIASVLAPYLSAAYLRQAAQRWLRLSIPVTIGVCVVSIFWLTSMTALVAAGWQRNWQHSQSARHTEAEFAAAAAWLATHAQPGDIVFHSDWDEFPQLWYHNDAQYYIVGLDPTFMYLYSPELYGRYENITIGRVGSRVAEQIKQYFHARYVLVNRPENQALFNLLLNDSGARLEYQDNQAAVFQLLETF